MCGLDDRYRILTLQATANAINQLLGQHVIIVSPSCCRWNIADFAKINIHFTHVSKLQ